VPSSKDLFQHDFGMINRNRKYKRLFKKPIRRFQKSTYSTFYKLILFQTATEYIDDSCSDIETDELNSMLQNMESQYRNLSAEIMSSFANTNMTEVQTNMVRHSSNLTNLLRKNRIKYVFYPITFR
jgi:hypothetical protein